MTVPAGAPDSLALTLTAQPTGTQVTVPLRVGDAAAGEAAAGSAGGALAVTGTDGAWMGAGILAALALMGLGVVIRRRSARRTD